MKLTLNFIEPFEFKIEAEVPTDLLVRFKNLDDLSEYIVDEYIYSKWLRSFEVLSKNIPIKKKEEAKYRYKSKMTEYVKKWIIEAILSRR